MRNERSKAIIWKECRGNKKRQKKRAQTNMSSEKKGGKMQGKVSEKTIGTGETETYCSKAVARSGRATKKNEKRKRYRKKGVEGRGRNARQMLHFQKKGPH